MIISPNEARITDYVTLVNGPPASLPDTFTVCSSLLVQFVTTPSNFIGGASLKFVHNVYSFCPRGIQGGWESLVHPVPGHPEQELQDHVGDHAAVLHQPGDRAQRAGDIPGDSHPYCAKVMVHDFFGPSQN